MACLDQIREHFIRIDMALGLIEETYALFAKFNVAVPKEEQEKVDSLRYNFELMIETVRFSEAGGGRIGNKRKKTKRYFSPRRCKRTWWTFKNRSSSK